MFDQNRVDSVFRIVQRSLTVLGFLVVLGPTIYNLATKETMREQFVEDILPPLMVIILSSALGISLNEAAATVVPRTPLLAEETAKPLISAVSQAALIFAMTAIYLERSGNPFLGYLLGVFAFAGNRGYDYYRRSQLEDAGMYQAAPDQHSDEEQKGLHGLARLD